MTMQEMPSPHLHGASGSRSASRPQALAFAPGSGSAGPSGASGGAGGTGASGASGGSGEDGGSAGEGGPFQHAPPAGHAKTFSAVLGEIVWLMSQSPLHKQFFISDLEWFVMTPALLQQFRLYYDQQKPIGVVLWASVSDEVAERLAQGTTKLRPQDWKSGDQLWVVEVIAPFGGAEEMVKDLKDKVFPTRPLSFLAVTDGRREVRTMTMPENPIPNFGVKPPHCFYGSDDHVRVAEALRREFPDIYNWMKLYPDGVSPEDSDEAKGNFDRLYAFIRSQLPESQFGDRNEITQLMFMAATYTPQMIQNAIQRHKK